MCSLEIPLIRHSHFFCFNCNVPAFPGPNVSLLIFPHSRKLKFRTFSVIFGAFPDFSPMALEPIKDSLSCSESAVICTSPPPC